MIARGRATESLFGGCACLLVAVAGTAFTAANGDSAAPTLVATERIEGRGIARLYASTPSDRLCLELRRRFRRDGRRRTDRWVSCGLPVRGPRGLKVRRRLACKSREMQLMGLAPRRTARVRGRLDTGRRVTLGVYETPSDVRARGKLFMHVARGSEIVRLRAFDRGGRRLASVTLLASRGPRCPGRESERDRLVWDPDARTYRRPHAAAAPVSRE